MFFVETENNIKDEMIDWLVGTVILAFLPALFSFIIFILSRQSIAAVGEIFIKIIVDGELIISSFLITAQTLIEFFKNTSYQTNYKKQFYSLLLTCFTILLAYAVIKSNTDNNIVFVSIVSIMCIAGSLFVSITGKNSIQS